MYGAPARQPDLFGRRPQQYRGNELHKFGIGATECRARGTNSLTVTARFDISPRLPVRCDALGPFIFAEHRGRRGPAVDGIVDQRENGSRPAGTCRAGAPAGPTRS